MNKNIFSLSCLLIMLSSVSVLIAQKNLIAVDSSVFTGIKLGDGVYLDKRGFFTTIAKSTLELETGDGSVSGMEVFAWPNKSNQKALSEEWMIRVINNLDSSGWKLQTSIRDNSYIYLSRDSINLLMYYAVSKKEANLYFGKLNTNVTFNNNATTDNVPPKTTITADPSAAGNNSPLQLIGNWGRLSGDKISYYNSSTNTTIGGLSSSSGLELKSDGSYIQMTLTMSGFPNYKVFSYITGTYTVNGNMLTLVPKERRYRKWQSGVLISDEYDKPPSLTQRWSIAVQSSTGKKCLYLQAVDESSPREYCSE